MGKYFCNPLNVPYRYQFNKDPRKKGMAICREAADPSLIYFKGKYYIFASMSLGYYVSEDLANWEFGRLPSSLPLYDYAPDVRVLGEYVYFCASSKDHPCDRFRTKDIEKGPYERIKGTFPFWDPNLFVDEDGRIYFYHGCTNTEPIHGVELDGETMLPKGSVHDIVSGDPFTKGYERTGEDNTLLPATEEEVEAAYQAFMKRMHIPSFFIPKRYRPLIRGMFTRKPFIEGAWMDKFQGRYYFQYASPGTALNTYNDSVYVSDSPLSGFTLAKNNPFSYKPGGFIKGAGHGSTLCDEKGAYWHAATMRISNLHDFERRIGLFPAGIDQDGDLYCCQAYADYPFEIDELRLNPSMAPKWMLLSYKKRTSASSALEGHEAQYAVDEDIRSFYQSAEKGPARLELDLGDEYDVRAVQINFADGVMKMKSPGKIRGTTQARYIEERNLFTRYLLSGSQDGETFFVIEDKREAMTDLSHDLIVREEGLKMRYLRLEILEVPYEQNPAISGFRVFGLVKGQTLPEAPSYEAKREGPLDITVKIAHQNNVTGHVVSFGYAPDKLYHSYMTFEDEVHIGALVKGQETYVQVESFNEAGITKGEIQHV